VVNEPLSCFDSSNWSSIVNGKLLLQEWKNSSSKFIVFGGRVTERTSLACNCPLETAGIKPRVF
jgi:hypothetical protein